ncbi:MAG: exonuclease [Nitrosopumilaceae archaeon]|nr:PD-(D/E)XK nuclease family protein [Nitrosopumilaceae archaeon]NIU86007.1 exonuclease [Nitrosopumilaceae archaeon]NIX60226.1 exonuclease [Nitrosopumilaceae archaeon]
MFKHKHHKVTRPFVEMLDTETGHYYKTKSGDIYPSITTMLHSFPNPGIDVWKARTPTWKKISESSMKVGTALHKLIEDYLGNKELTNYDPKDFEKDPYELFNVAKPELDKLDNIHALEMKLYSDELKLAGTVDCVAEIDGVPHIIDFKNSRKPKYPKYVKDSGYYLQGCAYSQMWHECIGDQIDDMAIFVVSWDNKVRVFKEKVNNHVNELWDTLIKYELL